MLKYITAVLGAVALAVIAPHARAQELKNPDQIAYVLKLLTHVQNDFGRQIDHKTYDRIPHENQEFHEAAEALDKAMANESPALKKTVDVALKAAVAAGQAVSDKNTTNDEAVLRAAHGEMIKKVVALDALFPASMRPDPKFMFQPGERAKASGAAPAAK